MEKSNKVSSQFIVAVYLKRKIKVKKNHWHFIYNTQLYLTQQLPILNYIPLTKYIM